MLDPESYNSFSERRSGPFYTAEEVYFDDLVHSRNIDTASEFITEYVEELYGEMEYHGYHPGYFRPALKKLALPMYKKIHADETGVPYHKSREEIPALYQKSIELMDQLLAAKESTPDLGYAKSVHLRGSLTELTIFALAVRGMPSMGNDYNIIPSSAMEDVNYPDANGDYTGFDFTVYDRNLNKKFPLQVKTSSVTKQYRDSIAVVSLNEFIQPLDVSIEELQQEIIKDANHSSFTAHKAARRLRHFLRTSVRDTQRAS